jgi:uncharacterized metal-binding protein
MNSANACKCGEAPRLIFPCSGGSDVGEIADRAGRKLSAENVGKMYCLAGIGGQVSGILQTTNAAADILVIDGCPLDCAKKTLERAGFEKFNHFRVVDLGIEKGKSPATNDRISLVAEHGRKILTTK